MVAPADRLQIGVQAVDVRGAGLHEFTAVDDEAAQLLDPAVGLRREQLVVGAPIRATNRASV